MYLPSPAYGFHPHVPERLGFRKLLQITNPELSREIRRTDRYTLAGSISRTTLYREAKRVLNNGVPGDFAEFGVYRGGTAAILAHALQGRRTLHLFDKWDDLPDTTVEDGHRAEQYAKANIPEKLEYIRTQPPLDDTKAVLRPYSNLRYWPGWLSDTLQEYDGGKIAFANVDCDYYESVRDVLAFLETRMSPGGTINVDDYGSWPGAKRATDEWLKTTSLPIASAYKLRVGPLLIRVRQAPTLE